MIYNPMYTIHQCQQIVDNMSHEEPTKDKGRNPVTVMVEMIRNIQNPAIKKEVQHHFHRIANSLIWKDPRLHNEAFHDIIDVMMHISEFTPSEKDCLQRILAGKN